MQSTTNTTLPCVLISASFVDSCLASMLKRFFVQGDTASGLLDSDRTLGTFAARSGLCYCLGFIPKGLYQNLRTLGDIRNLFAHSHFSLSFADAEVSRLCYELIPPKVVGKRIHGETGEITELTHAFDESAGPRHRFTFCVVLMAHRLMATGLAIERRTRKEKGWD